MELPDIPAWKYAVAGASTLLAVFWPKIQEVWANRSSKVTTAKSAKADDTPDPAIAEWAGRVKEAAPNAGPENQLNWILEGKTLMEVVVADRDRLAKE
jgi:hypothetical protein